MKMGGHLFVVVGVLLGELKPQFLILFVCFVEFICPGADSSGLCGKEGCDLGLGWGPALGGSRWGGGVDRSICVFRVWVSRAM